MTTHDIAGRGRSPVSRDSGLAGNDGSPDCALERTVIATSHRWSDRGTTSGPAAFGRCSGCGKRVSLLYETLNTLKSEDFFIGLHLDGAPDTPPPAAKLRRPWRDGSALYT